MTQPADGATLGSAMPVHRLSLRIALAIVCASGALAACTAGSDLYEGIAIAADDAGDELGALARRAAGGDKRAQLALGIRFETGDGVPVDWKRAERLYQMAAVTSGDGRAVYYSGIRPKSEGKILRRFEAPRYGLPAAKARLDALRRRRAEAERP